MDRRRIGRRRAEAGEGGGWKKSDQRRARRRLGIADGRGKEVG